MASLDDVVGDVRKDSSKSLNIKQQNNSNNHRSSFSLSYFEEDDEEHKDNNHDTTDINDISSLLLQQQLRANNKSPFKEVKEKEKEQHQQKQEEQQEYQQEENKQQLEEPNEKEQEDERREDTSEEAEGTTKQSENRENNNNNNDNDSNDNSNNNNNNIGNKEDRRKVKEDLKGLFTPDSFFVLKDMALEGNLDLTGLRGITWRVLLGVLTADTSMWVDQMQKHREKFAKLREKHIIDPHKSSTENELDKFNPLSQHEENPWNQYFQDADLQKEITHDVLRTYQGNPFFDKPSSKEILTRLLFLYAKEHSTTRYIQGMNELLAPILFVLSNEASAPTDSPSIFDIVSSAEHIEADSYTLFSHLLLIVGRWFSPLKSGLSPPTLSKKDALLDDKLYFGTSQADESTNLQIVQQCRHIHYDLLNEVEPHLARYLKDLQIEPHLYMLRWVRIVLTQVFTLPDVLIIWDGIFSFGNNAVLLDWLCVAMLVSIRHNLLGQDYSTCMQLLFNYPQNQDVRVLVGTARQLYTKFQHQRQISPPKSASSSSIPKQATTNTVTHRPSSSNSAVKPRSQSPASHAHAQTQERRSSAPVMRERAPTPPNVPQYPQFPQVVQDGGRPSTPGSAGQSQKQKSGILQYIFPEGGQAGTPVSQEEAQHLRNVAAHMANRLERVIFLLSSLPSTPENEETIKLASEEVNQVKSTLLEASEFKLKASLETFEQRHEVSNTNSDTIAVSLNNTNHNNTTATNSNGSNSNYAATTTSPPDPNQPQLNVYEKILSIDPLNIFRRK